MVRLLQEHGDEVRAEALLSLAFLGERAAPFALEMSKLTLDADADVSVAALQALGSLFQLASPCLGDIAKALCDGNASVRSAALRALAACGEHAAPFTVEIAHVLDMYIDSVQKPQAPSLLAVCLHHSCS